MCQDYTDINTFKNSVNTFIDNINEKLYNYSDFDISENEYDEIVNSLVHECSTNLSLYFDEDDLHGNHYDFDEEDPFYKGNVPRCRFIFLKNKSNSLVACITTVTSGFENNIGGYVGYIPSTMNVPIFFLEDITDSNYRKYYVESPVNLLNTRIFYEIKN